ncbi:MAG: hypothetical protein HWE21_14725, partial [Cytophagia bacterium]|nr:hypothetical protein [Cytophagia bacterium]
MNLSVFRVEKETFAQTNSFSSLKKGSTVLALFVLVLLNPAEIAAQHSPNGIIDTEILESKRKESVSGVSSKYTKSSNTGTHKTRKVVRASAGDVVINEIVTDPQTDWSTNDFDGT